MHLLRAGGETYNLLFSVKRQPIVEVFVEATK